MVVTRQPWSSCTLVPRLLLRRRPIPSPDLHRQGRRVLVLRRAPLLLRVVPK